jgi:hypothetical protein
MNGVIKTRHGEVRGGIADGVNEFKGIPYRAGFALECRAIKTVRDEMGLNSISRNPDTILKTTLTFLEKERELADECSLF